jgi:soluble lytic murein transglycosylase
VARYRFSASICAGAALWLAAHAGCQARSSFACQAAGMLDRPADGPLSLILASLPPEATSPYGDLSQRFEPPPHIDFTPTSRIPPDAASMGGSDLALGSRPDLFVLCAAVAAYQRGDHPGGDAITQRVFDPLQRTALDWIALRTAAQPGYDSLAKFGAAHPGWPSNNWIRYEQEAALLANAPPGQTIERLFANDPPRTPPGKLALARAARDAGNRQLAGDLVRLIWRDDALNGWTEGLILREFGSFLTRGDHLARADMRFYGENYGAAMQAAALAGPDASAGMRARLDALRQPIAPASIARLPTGPASDPALLFARIRALRHADRTLEAALLLERAPRDPARLVDGDRWWDEQRLVARSLLDAGLAKQAYALCRDHLAISPAARTDAEFLAGWIALRFLNLADEAAKHFARAAQFATTPLSISRATYWRGRAAEALGDADDADRRYRGAAAYPSAYYGQLAAQRLASPALPLHAPQAAATGDARDEAIRVVALMYDAQLDALALPLALDEARQTSEESQLAALAAVLKEHGDALASVEIGKRASERGFSLDEAAFPTFGVPQFTPVANSADLPAVYSVARQESEFVGHAASGAGARGLMQVLPSTARETARRVGLPFDAARLTGDSAFNAQIGGAFLGQLLSDEGGSPILAFAAYNAGPARVQQWIRAYGDPRTEGVDPVDWVERIPFDETRDYVQRVSENLGVYRVRLGVAAADERPGRMARADGP